MPRTLYHRESCADCEKVRLALGLERVPYVSVLLDPEDRGRVRALSGQETLPVLVEEDGRVFWSSNRILRHLAARPGSRLLPEGRRDQALTWVLVGHADAVLGPLCSVLASGAGPAGDAARGDASRTPEQGFDEEVLRLEGMLDRGPFLFGDRPTLADLALHAYINRLERGGGRTIPRESARARAWYGRIEDAVRG